MASTWRPDREHISAQAQHLRRLRLHLPCNFNGAQRRILFERSVEARNRQMPPRDTRGLLVVQRTQQGNHLACDIELRIGTRPATWSPTAMMSPAC